MKATIFLAVVSTAASIGTMVYNYVTRPSAPSSTETTSLSAAEINRSYEEWSAEAKKEHILQYPHATKRDHLLINDIGRFIAEDAGRFDLHTIRMRFRGVED